MPAYEALIPLATVALSALVCGLALARMGQPAIVGYIIAGVALGPSGLGLVHNEESIALLAELGVLMLLFVVGMELSLRAFRHVWLIAMVTTALQLAITFGAMMVLKSIVGWSLALTVLVAFVGALSSTAVAIKMLETIDELRTRAGRIAVGILIAQDLAVVPMILILDLVAGETLRVDKIALVLLSVILLSLLILALSRRRRIHLPLPAIVAQQSDLAPVFALGVCFGAATLSGLAGLTPAYGAFLGGLIIGNTNLRAQMLHATLPIQSVLMMVFFLSVGLLIDVRLLFDNLGVVLAILFVVTIVKTALNVSILALLRLPAAQALLVGAVLAQIGEFSFVLAGAGLRQNIISFEEFRLIVTVTALSLAASPLWLATARRLHPIAAYSRPRLWRVLRFAYGPEASALGRAARGTLRVLARLVFRGRKGRW